MCHWPGYPSFPLAAPKFPEPGSKGCAVPIDLIPTYAYNWCGSPHTPIAVAGFIWVPGSANISLDPADYAAELAAYCNSLPATHGQEIVPFFHAHPSPSMVEGVTVPGLRDA